MPLLMLDSLHAPPPRECCENGFYHENAYTQLEYSFLCDSSRIKAGAMGSAVSIQGKMTGGFHLRPNLREAKDAPICAFKTEITP